MEQLPDAALATVTAYLTTTDLAAVGALSTAYAQSRTLWAIVHIQYFPPKPPQQPSSASQAAFKRRHASPQLAARRATRSTTFPRVAFFNALRSRRTLFNQTAWEVAATLRRADSVKAVERCLQQDFPVNHCFPALDHAPLLCEAARHGRWKVAKFLVEKRGAHLNAATAAGGMTALLVASWRGDLLGVKTLLKLGRDAYLKKESSEGEKGGVTALDLCARGSPAMSSVCGSRGPHTAAEWARRKAAVCPDKPAFAAIVRLLEKEMAASGDDEEGDG